MKLYKLLHAPTRPAWTARLVAYVAVVVTLALVVQVAHALWLT